MNAATINLPEHIGGYQHLELPDAIVEREDMLVLSGVPRELCIFYAGARVDDVERDSQCNVYRKMPVPKACDDKECLKPLITCSVCGSVFTSPQPSAKYCSKRCRNRANKAAEMVRYHANPQDREKHLARSRAYSRANPEKNRARAAAWKAKNPERHRIWARKRQGMINPTGEMRQGACEACQCQSKLELDHDHSNGMVRGWLCGPCNRALGQAKDSIAILQSLITYLNRFR